MKQLYCIVILLLCAVPCMAYDIDYNSCSGNRWSIPANMQFTADAFTQSYGTQVITVSNCPEVNSDDVFEVYVHCVVTTEGGCDEFVYTGVYARVFYSVPENYYIDTTYSEVQKISDGTSQVTNYDFSNYDKFACYNGQFIVCVAAHVYGCLDYYINVTVDRIEVVKVVGDTCTPTNTPTNTRTNTPINTATNTPTVPTPVNTPTVTNTQTDTFTPTNTRTNTPTHTRTPTIDLPEAMDATPYVWSTEGDVPWEARTGALAYYGNDYAFGDEVTTGLQSDISVIVNGPGVARVWANESHAPLGYASINMYVDANFVIATAAITGWQELSANVNGTGDHTILFKHSVTTYHNSGVALLDKFTFSTYTPTYTPTNTPTRTFTSTPTRTSTVTNTATISDTPTVTDTHTSTITITNTPIDTPTATHTPLAGSTATNTPTRTNTATITNTYTPSSTSTHTYTPTSTYTYTDTPTATSTPTYTDTPTRLFDNTNPRLLGNTFGKPDIAADIQQPTLTTDVMIFTRDYLVGKILILFNR